MTDARFSKDVSPSDNRGDGLDALEIDSLSAVVAESLKGMDAIHRITTNASQLVSAAARASAQHAGPNTSGGHTSAHRRVADCLRDLDIILRQLSAATAAGSQGQLLANSELTAVVGRFEQAAIALAAAKALTANAANLVNGAARAVDARFPSATQPWEISAASDAQGREPCARAIRLYLGWITRSLLSSSATPLEEGQLAGLEAINRAVELAPARCVEALNYIKAHHGLLGQAGVIADTHIDQAIHSLI